MPDPRPRTLTPAFSSVNFIILALKFGPLIHLGVIFENVSGKGPPSVIHHFCV